jgi:hypothetical protein
LLPYLIIKSHVTAAVSSYRAILDNPGIATARWTAKQCRDHGWMQYTFEVEQVAHTGSRKAPMAVRCEDISLGFPVNVVYEKANPDNSFAGGLEDIPSALAGEKFAFIPLFFLAFIMCGILWRWSAWPKASAQQSP